MELQIWKDNPIPWQMRAKHPVSCDGSLDTKNRCLDMWPWTNTEKPNTQYLRGSPPA